MSVKRFKFPFQGNKNNGLISGDTSSYINIPISMNFSNMGQSDLIERDFINVELEKAINPIIDNEQIRFKPKYSDENINSLTYLLFLNDGTVSTLDELGYNYDDVQFNLNSFKKSFLRLYFYDTEITTNQLLLFKIDLFPEIYEEDKIPTSNNNVGQVKPLNQINAKLQSFNGNKFLDRSNDGFNIFYFKNEIPKNTLLNIYMRAEFFNAKTGEVINLITTNDTLDVTDINTNLFTKYSLISNSNGFIYEIDDTQPNVNFNQTEKNYNINLYKIKVN